MRLSPKTIASLQALFIQEYGIVLSDEEAQSTGLKIIRYVYAMENRIKIDAMKNKE